MRFDCECFIFIYFFQGIMSTMETKLFDFFFLFSIRLSIRRARLYNIYVFFLFTGILSISRFVFNLVGLCNTIGNVKQQQIISGSKKVMAATVV